MTGAPPRAASAGASRRPANRTLNPQGASLDNATERELREFLKVVRPDWSLISRHGCGAPIDKVMAKLKDIGVSEVPELIRRVKANSINMDLSDAGHSSFGEEALAAIRSKASFYKALEHLGSSVQYRQTGPFAPVPQLLAKTNLFEASKEAVTPTASIKASHKRPSTAPTGHHAVMGELPMGPRRSCTRLVSNDISSSPCRPISAPGCSVRPRSRSSTSCTSKFAQPSTATRGRLAVQSLRTGGDSSASSSAVMDTGEDEVTVLSVRPVLRYARPWSSPAGFRGGCSNGSKNSRRRVGHSIGLLHNHSSSVYSDCGDVGHGRSMEADMQSSSGAATEEAADAQLQELQQLPHEAVRPASWKSVSRNDLEDQVNYMLAEQRALDEKDKFFQAISREGQVSGLRRVVTDNIRCRLKQEERRDVKMVSDAHQQCFNIRNKLGTLKEQRRELGAIRKTAQNAIEGPGAGVFEALRGRFTVVNITATA